MGVSRVLGVVGVLLAVAALALNFVVAGPRGPTGPAGADGQAGADGADGIACWDLNGNGAPDLGTEDRTGAQGLPDGQVNVLDCAGPQGPGTLMASASLSSVVGSVACNEPMTVALSPETPGTIVVMMTLVLVVEHATGFEDLIDFFGGGCAGTFVGQELFPAALPSATYQSSVTVRWLVSVGSPGPYTIPVGVHWSAGVSAGDQLVWPVLVAVFYPA